MIGRLLIFVDIITVSFVKMFLVFVVPDLFIGANASELHFLAGLKIPHSLNNEACDLVDVNEKLLGLKADPDLGNSDIFLRPSAIVIISIDGVEEFPSDAKCHLLNNEVNPSSIDHIFSTNFAENRIWAKIESKEIKGSNVFSDIESVKFNETMISISTMPLRRELILLYKLSEAIKEAKSLVSLSPALYIVQIDGLESAKIEAPLDYRNAMRELIEAIIYFISNLKNSYGNRAIVELIIRTNGDNTHSIEKRQAVDDDKSSINKLRRKLNIYPFTSEDYPAIFAIFAGCGIILSVSVFFIAVGLWNMDPGKDSIIYRMTTTRMKKD